VVPTSTLVDCDHVVALTSITMSSLCSNPIAAVVVKRRRNATTTSRRAAAPVRCSAAEASAPLGRRDAIVSAAALLSLSSFVDAPAAHAAVLSSPSDGPVLVVGATGATGRRVVAQLLAKGVAVRAGSRDVKKAAVR
jgi:hypothetical protein